MTPFDGAAASDAEFLGLVDNAYVNSLRQFHKQAAEADAVLARELRKNIPADEREFCIRSHMVAMEQLARGILEHRDNAIAGLLRDRGFSSGKGSGDTTPTAKVPAVPKQPPGAFPDDGIHVSAVFEAAEPEPERELDPDVDEEIIIPLKGKAAKKKAKKGADVGRSTPTPAVAARPAPPATKAAPAPEKKAAPAVSGLGPKATTTARAASPAPITINTKLAPAAAVNGRATPAPMSPWEAAQAAKGGSSASGKLPETKPPSPPNGMWAPQMNRSTSKNPYAPSRPSRLAHVSEPESPEPPSPPPTREMTGQDYVAWFAGSSSEDERDADDGGLTEDEDEDDEDGDDGGAGAGWAGGILGALAGNSKWAMFGEGAQPQPPQRQAARSATPARGRAAAATPVPIPIPGQAGAGRYGADMGAGAGGAEWMRWGAPGGGAGPSSFGAGPASFGVGPASFGAGSASFGAGFPHAAFGAGAGPAARGRQWQSEEDDDLGNMLELTSGALNRGDGDVMQAMNTFLAAQKARETLATPVGVRAGTPSGRRR